MDSEKSYVGMSACFLCGEVKEILLDLRLKKTLQHKAVYNREPCDKCKGYMKQGVILISCRPPQTEEEQGNPYRTGGWVVVKESAAKGCLGDDFEGRVAFVDDESWRKLGLPYGDTYPGQEGYDNPR